MRDINLKATEYFEAVARLGRAMRYDVVRIVDGDEQRDVQAEAEPIGASVAPVDALETVVAQAMANGGDCAAVVASQGHYDEPAVETLLRSPVPYVGLVASRKRGDTIRAWLTESKFE